MARRGSMLASLPCSANAARTRPRFAAWRLQEDEHLKRFDALVAARGVRPTALQPFWSVAGYALGAATALIGPEAAMACTAAVEEEIDRHYSRQLDELEADRARTPNWPV